LRAMAVIRVSQREPNRLKMMVDLADGRILIDAASALMGIGRWCETCDRSICCSACMPYDLAKH
jgi:hypothetical protein